MPMPLEGRNAAAQLIYDSYALEVGLYTGTPTDSITADTIQTPAGGGYPGNQAVDLTVADDEATGPTIRFTAGAGGMSQVNGAFLRTTDRTPNVILAYVALSQAQQGDYVEGGFVDVDISNVLSNG